MNISTVLNSPIKSIPCDVCEKNIISGWMAPLPGYDKDVPQMDSRWICSECREEITNLEFFRIANGEVAR